MIDVYHIKYLLF